MHHDCLWYNAFLYDSMKKEIRQVSEDGKTVQITVADERFYVKTETDDNGNIISVKEYPSVTWKAGCYPKGIGYFKWLAEHGWDESQAIMREAGEKGSRVHHAVEMLLLGNEVNMDDELPNNDGDMAQITLDEYECIMSFVDWFNDLKQKGHTLEIIAIETTVFNEKHMYAGTIDLLCKIDGVLTIIDFKTGQYIWVSHEIQLSAYKQTFPDGEQPEKMAILQLGYRKNKRKWKYTEIEDKFDLYLVADRIWQEEHGNTEIFVKDYPTSLSLSL